jgi:protein-tyrosine-phosphatase
MKHVLTLYAGNIRRSPIAAAALARDVADWIPSI